MPNTIEFTCWETDESIEIQLEPECTVFTALAGNTLKFVAINAESDFKWTLRIDHKDRGIQLYPESSGSYDIEIYENEILIY